mgnify:CR=1 FL=1
MVIIRLMTLCEQVLEPLRQQCGIITITSGYRCPRLNLAVHGAPGSQHTLGEAADIFIPNEEALQKYVASSVSTATTTRSSWSPVPETPTPTPQRHRWLHVSYTLRRSNRHQILK